MIKEQRKKQKRMKKILIGFLIFLFVLLLATVIVWKVFVVKNVKVVGNVLYDEQKIKETVLNDEYSWNSLYVLLKYRFVDMEAIPFIDTMEVKMTNPQSLTIRVYEKGMMGYLYVPAILQNAYFDKDGFVVETSGRIIEGVPRIDGIACEQIVEYEKLPIDEQLLRQLLTLTQALKRDGLEPDSINYSAQNEPILYYGDVAVRLGSMDNLTLKVEHLSKILPSVVDKKGVLHMENWTEESANIIFEQTVVERDPADDNADGNVDGSADDTGADTEANTGDGSVDTAQSDSGDVQND